MTRARLGLVACAALIAQSCFLDRAVVAPDVSSGPDASSIDAGIGLDAARIETDAGLRDRDGDGVPDATDVCRDVPDPEQADLDGDGRGDACDDDRDGDHVPNTLDVCPNTDSRGVPDEDGDGLSDACDACPLDADPEQSNADGDRLGDACEDVDSTRFSRVVYLATFGSTLDGLTGDSDGVELGSGALRMANSREIVLALSEDPDHRGDYALDVRGTYVGPRGAVFPSGTFAALLRWTSDRHGYRMQFRSEDDVAEIVRHDGATCGLFGSSDCLETLADTGISAPDGSAFRLRATSFGAELALALSVGSDRYAQRVSDSSFVHGGVGLLVDEADVRIDAMAVYAP